MSQWVTEDVDGDEIVVEAESDTLYCTVSSQYDTLIFGIKGLQEFIHVLKLAEMALLEAEKERSK